MAALISSDRSVPQLPVTTLSAPEALILAMWGAKSFTGQRVQVFADDLHVGRLRQRLLEELGDLLAVRVVLVDQVDLLDLASSFMKVVSASIFIDGVGVEAEVPVAALAVGEVGSTAALLRKTTSLPGCARCAC